MRRALLALAVAATLGSAAFAQFSPEERAARASATEADYRATLARLGIEKLRPGADGRPGQANSANYDEAKAGTPILPPLLRTQAGAGVTTARDWQETRRPELLRLFADEMYGNVPAAAPAISWELAGEEKRVVAGRKVVTRRYTGRAAVNTGTKPLAIDLSVTLPEDASKVPTVLEFGFPEGFRFPGFTPPPGPTAMEHVVGRGWGFALLVPYTVQPDDGAGLSEGVIGLASGGRPRGEHDWGALRAWAWGASRAMDLLAADPGIDPHRIAIEGLSRYGKAALLTMATDERFSLGFIGSSGAGGAKLMRRNFGEAMGNLTSSGEYHWFAPAFLRYSGPRRIDDLPVDAHMLVALAAPRPLFIGAGVIEQDGWVDPRGSYEAALAANPAYRLFGVPGLESADYPGIGPCRCTGRIAFRQHEGGHSNALNWPSFLDFAARMWDRDSDERK